MFILSPPPAYASGPLPAGLTYTYAREADVDALCARALGPVPHHGYYYACYVPATHTIYLSKDLPTRLREQLKAHEEAHARGWVHDAADIRKELGR